MVRSTWKFSYINSFLYKYIFKSKLKKIKIKKLFCRSSSITNLFLKNSILLYKGNLFSKIFFTKYNLGYKIGEFSITRKPFNYPHKKTKKKR